MHQHKRMELAEMRNGRDEVDQVGAAPAQLLAQIIWKCRRCLREATRLKAQPRLIAPLHQLTREEAILTIFDFIAKERALFHIMVNRQQAPHACKASGSPTGT